MLHREKNVYSENRKNTLTIWRREVGIFIVTSNNSCNKVTKNCSQKISFDYSKHFHVKEFCGVGSISRI
jgi:hypothetical protein